MCFPGWYNWETIFTTIWAFESYYYYENLLFLLLILLKKIPFYMGSLYIYLLSFMGSGGQEVNSQQSCFVVSQIFPYCPIQSQTRDSVTLPSSEDTHKYDLYRTTQQLLTTEDSK